MRNLWQHPITTEEIVDTLDRYLKEWYKKVPPPIGDITGLCLYEAIQRIKELDKIRADLV